MENRVKVGQQNYIEGKKKLGHRFGGSQGFGSQLFWGGRNKTECVQNGKARTPFGIHDIYFTKLYMRATFSRPIFCSKKNWFRT